MIIKIITAIMIKKEALYTYISRGGHTLPTLSSVFLSSISVDLSWLLLLRSHRFDESIGNRIRVWLG